MAVKADYIQSNPADFYIPALAINAMVYLNMSVIVPALRNYMPLNFVEIYNPSTTTLTVRVESQGGEMFRIEAGSSRTLRLSFNNLIVTNIGGFNLAANTAILTLQKLA
jgi:hypothetical protein